MSWWLVLVIVVFVLVAGSGIYAMPSWIRYRRIRRM